MAERRKIKLKFIDQWAGHVPEEDKYYKLLSKHFDIELSDSPDYVIDGGLGDDYLRYDNAIKIANIGENIVPDFNFFDYAIGFDRLDFGDRYLRVPLYAFYGQYEMFGRREAPDPKALLDRDFCSYVVSNAGRADPIRTQFFHELCKYKKVDSGGRHLNNVGGPVADKMAFCAKYKFNIAFENCSSPGYVTEKVMQPMTCFSLPIYYGDPLVEEEFSPQSIVRVRGREDIERAIDEVIRLDRNDDEYIARVTAPCLAKPFGHYEKLLEDFLVAIFAQSKDEARRLNIYGYQRHLRDRRAKIHQLERIVAAPIRFTRKIMG